MHNAAVASLNVRGHNLWTIGLVVAGTRLENGITDTDRTSGFAIGHCQELSTTVDNVSRIQDLVGHRMIQENVRQGINGNVFQAAYIQCCQELCKRSVGWCKYGELPATESIAETGRLDGTAKRSKSVSGASDFGCFVVKGGEGKGGTMATTKV
jgi:hypothetical protein